MNKVRALSIVLLVMLLTSVCFGAVAEEQTSLEETLAAAILHIAPNFEHPASVCLQAAGNYEQNTKYEGDESKQMVYGPDTIVAVLSFMDAEGKTEVHYVTICLKGAVNTSDDAKFLIDIAESSKNWPGMEITSLSLLIQYKAEFGDYVDQGIAYKYYDGPMEGLDVAAVNRILAEHWGDAWCGQTVASAGQARTEDCDLCGNSGEVSFECPDHKANVLCPACGFTGEYVYKENCPSCNGKGRYSCSFCGGQGVVKCTYCGGRNAKNCTHCNTKGYMVCPMGCSFGVKYCSACSAVGYTVLLRQICPVCSTDTVCSICRQSADLAFGLGKSTCPKEYPDRYMEYVFNQVMRTPDEYLGKQFAVSGKIISIEPVADGVSRIVLAENVTGNDAECELVYQAKVGSTKLLKGDVIRFYGTFMSYTAMDVPTFVGCWAELQ